MSERWNKALSDRLITEPGKNDPSVTVQITAPYNFVELPPYVLPSPWSEEGGVFKGQPRHDRPLAKGVSGKLQVEWTFETPFLIGANEKLVKDGKTIDVQVQYPDASGNLSPVIPGASLRGMLRNVLEIATAARMTLVDQEAHFSFRDRGLAPLHNINCGFLTYIGNRDNAKNDNGNWTLTPCQGVRIESAELCRKIGIDVAEFEKMSGAARAENFFVGTEGELVDETWCHCPTNPSIAGTPDEAAEMATLTSSGTANANAGLVLFRGHDETGDNTSEVFFFHSGNEQNPVDTPETVMARFRATHSHLSQRSKPRSEWTTWQWWLDAYCQEQCTKIPVFWVGNADGDSVNPQEFYLGMSRSIKIPHANSPASLQKKGDRDGQIRNSLTTDLQESGQRKTPGNEFDFVQALFGHVPLQDGETKSDAPQTWSLKGRIFFRHGNLHEEETVVDCPLKSGITEKPRASFAPYYLRPTDGNQPTITWSANDTKLAGFKRYPIRKQPVEFPAAGSDSQTSHMQFQKSGKPDVNGNTEVCFNAPVKLHNLHPIEFGALLWAISWQAPSKAGTSYHRHSLGRGKPQGYGRVRGQVLEDGLQLETGDGRSLDFLKLDDYVTDFQNWLCEQVKIGLGADSTMAFEEIPHIAELMAMADPEIGGTLAENDRLRYPKHPTETDEGKKSLFGYSAIKKHAETDSSIHLWRYPTSRREDDSG